MQRLAAGLPRPLVLVPTMGALHAGHIALIRRAGRAAGRRGTTVASVFVNPTQFGPTEDYQRYPRPFRQDCAQLAGAGCDLVFAPAADAMYLADRSIAVTETALSSVMCGASRPGHFNGVCTVVSKLFNLVRPDFAIFGEKDFQQLAILRRLVRDLNFAVRLISHPIVREADGLAMSSRNAYLSPAERQQAPILFATLQEAARLLPRGAVEGPALVDLMRQRIGQAPLARIDYAVTMHPDTLQPALRPPMLLAVAVYFGRTRLIDNLLVR